MYLLDHLVHFVEKPERLVETTKELGLHTVSGGRHEMWGTYNSLCYFGLSYIEFIGIFDLGLFEVSAREPFTLHETYKKKDYQNSVLRIALRTNKIDEVAHHLASDGYEVYGPKDFSRTRPDGSVIKWKLLHFGKESQKIDFPFIIQWDGDDKARYKELVEIGTIKPHQLGNLQITEIEFELEDLSIPLEWGRVFDFEVTGTESYKQVKLPNCMLTFKETMGTNKIAQVNISGADREKKVEIEGTTYLFQT